MEITKELVQSVCAKLGIMVEEGTGGVYLRTDAGYAPLDETDFFECLENSVPYSQKSIEVIYESEAFTNYESDGLPFAS